MLKVVELIDRKKPSMIKVANANGFPAVVFTEHAARNRSAFAGYQILVARRFWMVLCKDFVQRIDLEQSLKT